jgi:hypothetical protein
MAVSKKQCTDFVHGYVAKYANVPISWVSDKTTFAQLNFGSPDFTELARQMNGAHWHNAYFWPGELSGCTLVGEVVTLLHSKANKS